jgi:nucleolin
MEGGSSGIAFVEFKTHAGADKAINAQGQMLLGRRLQISWAKDRSDPATVSTNTHSVFVKNVSFETNEDTIRSIFEDCGEIVSIRCVNMIDRWEGF